MEFLSKLIIGVLGAFAVVWTVVEYLAIPVVLVVIGLICGFGWEYYVISLVAYVLLVAIMHLIGYLADKVFEKTAGPVIEKKLEKLFDSIIEGKEKE